MNIDDKDKNGDTAFIMACEHNRPEIIRYLVDNGSDVNVQSRVDGWTGLMSSVWHGNFEIVKYLLEHGANPNFKTQKGWTALTYAQSEWNIISKAEHREPYKKIIILLREYGAK